MLSGTPHLFINDTAGVLLHWGGDTRALAGRTIQWGNTCTLQLPQLEATARGDPWLSAGLPQVGPVIYQAKWEQDETEPTLLRIRTIDDVELFGINEANYGLFVQGRSDWEPRYGFQVGHLQVGPLASADSYAWPAADQAAYSELLINMKGVESAALSQATAAGIDPDISLPAIAECEEAGLTTFDQTRNASTSLAATQTCINNLAYGPIPSPPTAPTNLSLTGVGVPNAVRLDWIDTSTNESGFRIIRNQVVIASVPAQTTTYTDPAAPPGLVCYSVVAFNSGGQAQSSDQCTQLGTGPSGPPTPPVNLRVSPGQGNTVQLTWTDTSTNEDGFRIRRGDQVIATVGANATTYTDVTANAALANCYQVIAFNAQGFADSNTACTTPTQPGTPVPTISPQPTLPAQPTPQPTLPPQPTPTPQVQPLPGM
jgi:hypothetical protein